MSGPILAQNSFSNAGRQGGRTYVQFGGLQVPVGSNFGSQLAYIDLNDGVVFKAKDIKLPDSHELEIAQQLWRAKQSYVSEDWGPLAIGIPYEFHAVDGASYWGTLRPLPTYGEQLLTFDGVYAFTVRCKSIGSSSAAGGVGGLVSHLLNNGIPTPSEGSDGQTGEWWEGELEFWMKEPFLKKISQSSQLANAIAGGSGGVTTNFAVTYGGTIWGEPQWILNVPNTNTATITQLQISNTSSGETVVIGSLNLSASNAHTITIDSSAWTISVDGTAFDLGGSFPMLYPGANNISVTVWASAATTGLTMDVKWYERWA